MKLSLSSNKTALCYNNNNNNNNNKFCVTPVLKELEFASRPDSRHHLREYTDK